MFLIWYILSILFIYWFLKTIIKDAVKEAVSDSLYSIGNNINEIKNHLSDINHKIKE